MGGKRRILVVDDEEINREMLGMILSGDYEVLYAEDGEKALEICGEHDCVGAGDTSHGRRVLLRKLCPSRGSNLRSK